ncbi:uncharacterized protein LOC131940966 [Physella acuta]|uniref:uncharacterized protein LOC131940966 n=1 Tax=Physella acuta TaxID=109671 RepID=UPI0027DE0065|nr:uncharacterized protein LOC131940966 [Physella acuta]
MKLRALTLAQDDEGFKGTSWLWRIGIFVTIIGLIAYVIGFSTDRWCGFDNELYQGVNDTRVEAHFGLWRKCLTLTSVRTGAVITEKCENLDNDDAYKPASKALCSIGLIVTVCGVGRESDSRISS